MNKKTKICLNAMVGNEAPTITRMLESVAPHIDYTSFNVMVKKIIPKRLLIPFLKKKTSLVLPIKRIGISLVLTETIHFKKL